MCGIAGVLGSRDTNLVKGMISVLHHRGPDGHGFHTNEDMQLGMCRLSIIDIPLGKQPIYNETGEICIIFNGEIYNYRELRQQLCKKGHMFQTQSDTEVIIHLYEEYGSRCVNHLQGMFAFAIADGKKLFLARDRLGIKPLYYSYLPEKSLFLFASEIKSLLQCKDVSTALDIQTLIDRIVYTPSIKEYTFFRDIKDFPPGHIMLITNDEGCLRIEKKAYYQIKLGSIQNTSFETAKEQLSDLLFSTVRSHLTSDVEVGLTLSGGLDSSVLAMLMNEIYDEKITMFTIAGHKEHQDIEHSKIVANYTRYSHDITVISFEDYFKAIPYCMQAEETISSLLAVPFYILCQIIGQDFKVCLNGEGADELFGGYPEYTRPYYITNDMANNLQRAKQFGLTPRREVLEILNLLTCAPTFEEYLRHIFEVNLQDSLVRLHLNPVDKIAMAAGLELRVPYLDHKLVEFVNSLPLQFKVNKTLVDKYILRHTAIDRYGHRLGNIPFRKKMRFPFAPRYLANFDALCNKLLPENYLVAHPLEACFTSKRELLIFELFLEIFANRRGVLPEDFDLLAFIKERTPASFLRYA